MFTKIVTTIVTKMLTKIVNKLLTKMVTKMVNKMHPSVYTCDKRLPVKKVWKFVLRSFNVTWIQYVNFLKKILIHENIF
jgi:large-conductance mechanosensitive channel